jgi:hypothetical protein
VGEHRAGAPSARDAVDIAAPPRNLRLVQSDLAEFVLFSAVMVFELSFIAQHHTGPDLSAEVDGWLIRAPADRSEGL